MCRRDTELGDLFAEGVLKVEKELGLEGVAVHVKGMEPAGYDPRSLKGMGLAFVATSRGACHLRATFYKAELAGFSDPQVVEGKAATYIDWEDRLCIMDTLIYCRFYRDLVPWPFITDVVNAAGGTDYSTEDLHVVANRIITETHRFNELRGFTARAKERLPAWITERATDDEHAADRHSGRDGLHARRVLRAPRLGGAGAVGAAWGGVRAAGGSPPGRRCARSGRRGSERPPSGRTGAGGPRGSTPRASPRRARSRGRPTPAAR